MLSARLEEDIHAKTDLISFLADGLDAHAIKERDKLVDILRWEGIFFFSAGEQVPSPYKPRVRTDRVATGSDTTSSALCALFFYFSRNPTAYHSVASEIRATFTSAADIRVGPALYLSLIHI